MTPAIALEQPGIRRLLGQLLERLERNPTRDRVPMQKLDPDHMPEFGPNRRAGEGDAAWKALKALEVAGFVTIDPIRSKLGLADYELSPRVRLVVDREEELRSLAGIVRRGPGPQQLWREALARVFGAADPRVGKLATFRMPFIEGRSLEDLAKQLKGLGDARPPAQAPLRTISARYFWADSKFLDDRADMVATLLGEDVCPHPEMRVQLGVRIGSDDFHDVVIIENQDTFDLVCRVTASIHPMPVVICAHGFKASAQRIRSPHGCLPMYVHQPGLSDAGRIRFERWLFRTSEEEEVVEVWFWGDLDWEGMKILKSLRDAFPDTRSWEPGYAPMAQALRCGLGHLPVQARKDGQREIEVTGCTYADRELLPALKHYGRFIDQEIVLPDELETELRLRGS